MIINHWVQWGTLFSDTPIWLAFDLFPWFPCPKILACRYRTMRMMRRCAREWNGRWFGLTGSHKTCEFPIHCDSVMGKCCLFPSLSLLRIRWWATRPCWIYGWTWIAPPSRQRFGSRSGAGKHRTCVEVAAVAAFRAGGSFGSRRQLQIWVWINTY